MNAKHRAPTIFNAYNARFLSPREVARTFVPPTHFDRLVERNHSLVLGPRGSGKTTLLMMLQREALDAWEHEDADEYRSRASFTGVFIPADVSWGKQIAGLGDGKLDQGSLDLFGRCAFITHALHRLVVAMEYEASRSDVNLQSGQEADVVSHICNSWGVSRPCSSLRALKYALSSELSQIRAIASEEVLLGPNGRNERLASIRYLHRPLVESLVAGIEIFDDMRQAAGAKWCLLFDELEIAPPTVRSTLLASLRSVDERLLFKLSLAPATVDVSYVADALSATPGNDFSVIPLWYPRKEQSRPFCNELWNQMLAERGMSPRDPTAVLGNSAFDTDADEWTDHKTAYGPKSRLSRRFRDLREKDETFKTFLSKSQISISGLHKLSSDKRASLVRKATSIVAIRDAVIREHKTGEQKSGLRTREVLEVFSGASALFAIVEGNPRWFKAIFSELLPAHGEKLTRIDNAKQTRAANKAANRFRALLRTVPCPPLQGKQPSRGLLTLVDLAGMYFFRELIHKDFGLDPAGTFVLDSRVSEEVAACVKTAVNTGALVLVNDSDDELPLTSLRGKRFRLSYLLAAQFPNLIRLERSVNLHTIIERSKEPKQRGKKTLKPLPLFKDTEPEEHQ